MLNLAAPLLYDGAFLPLARGTEMHVFWRFYRHAGGCALFIATIFVGCLLGFTQTPQIGRSFPTEDNPRVVIWNAFAISITSWEKREVSIAASIMGAAAQAEEVSIKSENNNLVISCHPSKRDRNISLVLRVPAKAVVEIKNDANTVQVKEPEGQIIIFASKTFIQLVVRESSTLDMEDAPNAFALQRVEQGRVARIAIGRRRTGTGRPYVKVTATKAQIAVTLDPDELARKSPTLAAQTIARRGGLMGEALRRSSPQLIRPHRDQTGTVGSLDKEEGALKLEAHLVNLNVSATDIAGRAVPGLKQADFSVYEDGVPQRVSFFSPEQSPFNLVLLLDLSGSMKDEIELIKATAIHFLDVIRPQDNVAVITFTTDVTAVSHLTKDRDDLRESIDYMLAPAGGTAFYDALGYVLVEELRKVKGQRNAVIAITDGEDNAIQAQLLGPLRLVARGSVMGSFLTFEELLDGAKEADALIYPIHLDPASPQQINPGISPRTAPFVQIQPKVTELAVKQLQSLADASGARFYHANRFEDLKGVFEQVAAELRTVYSMAYTPKDLNFDGRFRRIRVQINQPGVAIRTRSGYYGR